MCGKGQFIMAESSQHSIQKKVYAYILKRNKENISLLVFDHVDFAEAGTQVPGGTDEPGESLSDAAIREVQEETDLQGLNLIVKLGVNYHDLNQYGLTGVYERHYFLFTLSESTPDSWIGYETDPSDGSPGPIALKFYWVDLDEVPPLAGDLDEMIPTLITRIKKEAR
jgi:8-oxo-dGTP pyrophosphatase MutT (NUDIX family)